MKKILAVFFAVFALTACPQVRTAPESRMTVKVFTSAGTRQCEGGIDNVDARAAKLLEAGVRLIESSCAVDGRMYPAVCGGGDGRRVVFDVPVAQQSLAVGAGYGLLTSLSDAAQVACRR